MLPSRALVHLGKKCISVAGKDAARFLNGLLTIKPCMNPDSLDPVGSYAALLNAKGRVVSDLFLYSVPNVPEFDTEYLLEVDAANAERVLAQLDFYKLAADVEISETAIHTSFFWDDDGGLPQTEGVRLADARVPSLGSRILSLDPPPATQDPLQYQIRRYLFGIPEGTDFSSGKSLPLEFNLDYLNGVDFEKGCYVGQELTIRTHHHGIVRKRIVPFVLGEETSEDLYVPTNYGPLAGEPIHDASPVPNGDQVLANPFGSAAPKKPAGSIINTVGNIGLASMRIDVLGHKFHLADGTRVSPMIPFWWPEPSTN